MATFQYDLSYDPPFPSVEVTLRNSNVGLSVVVDNALLDTGSDGTMIPTDYLRQIRATPISDARIRSHWGDWRPVQLFVLDLQIEDLTFPGVFAIGDDQDDEMIIGRDVLNKLRFTLDGPEHLLHIPPQ
jgi:predicted aspartyl protease